MEKEKPKSKTSYRPKRNPEWTVMTVNLPRVMKQAVAEEAQRQGRYPVQLWRMAMAHAIKLRFQGIEIVD